MTALIVILGADFHNTTIREPRYGHIKYIMTRGGKRLYDVDELEKRLGVDGIFCEAAILKI